MGGREDRGHKDGRTDGIQFYKRFAEEEKRGDFNIIYKISIYLLVGVQLAQTGVKHHGLGLHLCG